MKKCVSSREAAWRRLSVEQRGIVKKLGCRCRVCMDELREDQKYDPLLLLAQAFQCNCHIVQPDS